MYPDQFIHVKLSLVAALSVGATCLRAMAGGVVYVDQAATGANNGSSWMDAYTDLRAAMSLASAGSELWVADGVYHAGADPAFSFELRTGVAVYGGFAGTETLRSQRDFLAHPTILSGDINGDDQPGWVNMMENTDQIVRAVGVDGSALFDGFRIEGGRNTWLSGAGIYVQDASPTIANCVVTRCISDFAPGGGMMINNGSPSIESCDISGNYAYAGRGGGVYMAGMGSPIFSGCRFAGNIVEGRGGTVADGAGAFLEFDMAATFDGCLFERNQAYPNMPLYSNGGAVCSLASGLTMRNCVVAGNRADSAGGVWFAGDALIIGCAFTGNTSLAGGAMVAFNTTTSRVIACSMSLNDAPDGGALSLSYSDIDVSGCVLWGNTGVGSTPYNAQIHSYLSNVNISYSCIEGLFALDPGEDPHDPNNFPYSLDADPLFVDPNGPDNIPGSLDDDLRLMPSSPCIDAGNNNVLAGLTTDVDGLPRFHQDNGMPDTGKGAAPFADMGAHEFQGATTGFILARPVPGAGGQRNTIKAAGATPGARVDFFYGPRAGSTSVPGCPGLSLGILNPTKIGSAMADGSGNEQVVKTVPAAAYGLEVRIQALERSACRTSNLVIRDF